MPQGRADEDALTADIIALASQFGRYGYNLNPSRYISTAVGEEEIELAETQRELIEIEKLVRDATSRHNGFLKELGLSLLPGGD